MKEGEQGRGTEKEKRSRDTNVDCKEVETRSERGQTKKRRGEGNRNWKDERRLQGSRDSK